MQTYATRLKGKVVLVTGASRGIGARVAERLGDAGARVIVNYRTKAPRAEQVANEVRRRGGQAMTVCADLTDHPAVQRMVDTVKTNFQRIDVLILNASGGLEKGAPADYGLHLNRDAQLALVDEALDVMEAASRIVFVTSHMAHFHGQKPGLDVYEPVAASKHAGEQALRQRVAELDERGVRLIVVSGDLIDGTTTPRLMQRQRPGIIEARREAAGGWLPTVDDFAAAIVEAAANPALETGSTVYVGSTE